MTIICPNGCHRRPTWSWSLTSDNVYDPETCDTIESTVGEICDCCAAHIIRDPHVERKLITIRPNFDEILERYDDDETALRYIREDGLIKGLFAGSVVTSIIFWVLS